MGWFYWEASVNTRSRPREEDVAGRNDRPGAAARASVKRRAAEHKTALCSRRVSVPPAHATGTLSAADPAFSVRTAVAERPRAWTRVALGAVEVDAGDAPRGRARCSRLKQASRPRVDDAAPQPDDHVLASFGGAARVERGRRWRRDAGGGEHADRDGDDGLQHATHAHAQYSSAAVRPRSPATMSATRPSLVQIAYSCSGASTGAITKSVPWPTSRLPTNVACAP